MNAFGLIVARGGSKGIPGKNTLEVAGRPLIHWPILAANESNLRGNVYLSTDSRHIAEVCKDLPVQIPFMRPAHLATDSAPVSLVIQHAISSLREAGKSFDYVVLLQPTSPLVDAPTINQALDLASHENADTVISITKAGHHHPRLMYTRGTNGNFVPAFPELHQEARRQDEAAFWVRTGAAYVINCQMLMTTNSIYGRKIFGLEVPDEMAICIDEPLDLEFAKVLLNRKYHAN